MIQRALSVGAAAVAAVTLAVLVWRHVSDARASARAAQVIAAATARGDRVLAVPVMDGPVTLDGDQDDPGWTGSPAPARTGAFVFDNDAPAIPFSEVRAVWGTQYLYLSLYASDSDIESRTDEPDGPVWLDDAFRMVFSRGDVEYSIEVSPRAIITDARRRRGGAWDYSWQSGAHASKEWDGTLNDPKNIDEEWVIEMVIPLESLGLKGERGESIGFTVSRCDQQRTGGQRVCASWGQGDRRGLLVLD